MLAGISLSRFCVANLIERSPAGSLFGAVPNWLPRMQQIHSGLWYFATLSGLRGQMAATRMHHSVSGQTPGLSLG